MPRHGPKALFSELFVEFREALPFQAPAFFVGFPAGQKVFSGNFTGGSAVTVRTVFLLAAETLSNAMLNESLINNTPAAPKALRYLASVPL
jgi:hypothetical protein